MDSPLNLLFGYNSIRADLYSEKDIRIGSDTVQVYRSYADQFVSITSPADHSLVNTDMVEVAVKTLNEEVSINGQAAEFITDLEGNYKRFFKRIWLKEGFNTITAIAPSHDGAQLPYKDSIRVFYRKNNAIFKLSSPANFAFYKAASGTVLGITGEIDTLYRPAAGQAGELVKNRVSADITYIPDNPNYQPAPLVTDRELVIAPAPPESSLTLVSPYIFYNDFSIPLQNLSSGRLEINVFKNRQGTAWEDKISRIVYIDDSQLAITLVQPNVFMSDELDTIAKISNFNNNINPFTRQSHIAFTNTGGLTLSASAQEARQESLRNVTDIIETPEGDLVALVNSRDQNTLTLYKQSAGDSAWMVYKKVPGLYGYKLCYTPLGILMGVSNLNAGSQSGLYLLHDAQIYNVRFPVIAGYVQFLKYRDGRVYFYGNYYSHLYSFDLFSITRQDNLYTVAALESIPFENNVSIKQFELTSTLQTAVILTEKGQLGFYTKKSEGYQPVSLPVPPSREDESTRIFTQVVCGEYAGGEYIAWLLCGYTQDDNGTTRTFREGIMEKKNAAAAFFPYDLTHTIEPLVASGFYNDCFYLLSGNEKGFRLMQGKIFFSQFQTEATVDNFYPYPHQESVYGARDGGLLITARQGLYLGMHNQAPPGVQPEELICLVHDYETQGDISFRYDNPDIEGITGFDFQIAPCWLKAGSPVNIGFSVISRQKDVLFTYPALPLDRFLESASAFFRVSHTDKAPDQSCNGNEYIQIVFVTIQL